MPIRPDTTSSACTSERRLPYRDDLVIVSKVGAQHVTDGQIPLAAAQKPAELRAAVEDDLRQLGLESVPVVNLRRLDLGPGLAAEGDQAVDLDDQLAEMIALRDEGKVGAIGISSVPLDILRRALPAGIVCVQNAYSVLDRAHEAMLNLCEPSPVSCAPSSEGRKMARCRTSGSMRRPRPGRYGWSASMPVTTTRSGRRWRDLGPAGDERGDAAQVGAPG